MKPSVMRSALACAAVTAAIVSAPVMADQVVKIAFIDPLSGLMGSLGQNQLNSWKYVVAMANQQHWAKGVTFEMVGMDNKLSPQESLTDLKNAEDQDIRYVTQGNGSGVGLVLEDAVQKYNDRNPGHEILYLNYAAVDPDMTNSKCSFWHFRLDANSDMKMEALTTFLAQDKSIHKVYLFDQDYSFGHAVSRAAREYLARKRPDIQIVGDDFHPLAKVTDFSPYVAKIKSSGADTVITGNWGSDLALLIKAAKDADLKANFYTYYAGTTGVPTAMGTAGEDRVYYVGYWNPNNDKFVGGDIITGFKKQYHDDFYVMAAYSGVRMLADAINKSGSIEPLKVATAMEGAKVESLNGEITMRASDHQMEQPLYIAKWVKVDGKTVKFDQENQGLGWKTVSLQPEYVGAQPTTCQMKRPS
jgi:branched-chain amino acid transport system substrate-binding protein